MIMRPWCCDKQHAPLFQSYMRRNPFRKKKRQKKSIFIYGTTFKKNESCRDFQRGQIWNDRSQKQKKNYGSHRVGFVILELHTPVFFSAPENLLKTCSSLLISDETRHAASSPAPLPCVGHRDNSSFLIACIPPPLS